jgi:hypothetical protein
VIYQFCGSQGECIAFAERVALQELQMRLLAPLPLRDALKIVDVPADELGERGRSLLDAVSADGSSSTTSRCFAQLTAAERCAKVRASW